MANYGYAQNFIHVCVDKKDLGTMEGRVFHDGVPGVAEFHDVDGLLMQMERLCDQVNFPESSTLKRSFKAVQDMVGQAKPGKDEGVASMENEQKSQGKKATFVVQVQYRQNATWQGTVNWVEQNEEKPFRSALELIRLIDQATEGLDI